MNTILVTTSRGLDELLKQEVLTLCPEAEIKVAPGQLQFSGELIDAYRVCLWSRLANRVVWVLAEGSAESAEAVYDTAASIDWSMHMRANQTLSVQFNGTNRAINNSQFGGLKVKDAVVDHFLEEGSVRPNVEKHQPDILIHARCHRDKLIVGLDLSGGSLHQRAYRTDTGAAPLKEHVAAAMLMRSGWASNTDKPLYDLMCGSGTLAIEAAFMASNTAPALKRHHWGFSEWLGHNESQWQALVSEAENAKVTPPAQIIASDIDRRLVNIAKQNADEAGVFSYIRFANQDAVKAVPDNTAGAGYLVSNPPYGERLGELTSLLPLFSQWGQQLKSVWRDWQVSLLSSNRELLRVLKLRAAKEYAMMNGKLECKLVNYVLDEANCQQYGDSAENHEFANRLRKNLKKMKPWLKKIDTNCYRIYDADLPDYNVAIDQYGEWLVVQEYAPPKNIEAEKSQRRLQEVLLHLPAVMQVPASQVVLKVRQQQKGKNQYEKMDKQGKRLTIWENGAKLLVNLTDYLDTGLFLDHRTTREKVKALSKGKDVLNLFSYTGSVSVAAALGGARSVTTVDMSRTYLDWAKDNFEANKLKGPYHFVQADCLQWLATHNGQYDFIFIDPPSFSNSKRMDQTWDVQRDHLAMLTDARKCLKSGGKLQFSNNKRGFKLDESGVAALGFSIDNISQETLPEDFKRRPNIHQCWLLSL